VEVGKMVLHKEGKKLKLVCDSIVMQQILVVLSQSQNLQGRKIALEMTQAFDELGKRESKKK
jgi:hypothetical protein